MLIGALRYLALDQPCVDADAVLPVNPRCQPKEIRATLAFGKVEPVPVGVERHQVVAQHLSLFPQHFARQRIGHELADVMADTRRPHQRQAGKLPGLSQDASGHSLTLFSAPAGAGIYFFNSSSEPHPNVFERKLLGGNRVIRLSVRADARPKPNDLPLTCLLPRRDLDQTLVHAGIDADYPFRLGMQGV